MVLSCIIDTFSCINLVGLFSFHYIFIMNIFQHCPPPYYTNKEDVRLKACCISRDQFAKSSLCCSAVLTEPLRIHDHLDKNNRRKNPFVSSVALLPRKDLNITESGGGDSDPFLLWNLRKKGKKINWSPLLFILFLKSKKNSFVTFCYNDHVA